MLCEAKKYLDDGGDDVYRHHTAQIQNSSRKELDVSSIELLLTHKRLWDIQVEGWWTLMPIELMKGVSYDSN